MSGYSKSVAVAQKPDSVMFAVDANHLPTYT